MDPIALADLDWDNKKLIEEGCFGGEVYKSKLEQISYTGNESSCKNFVGNCK